VVALSPMRPIVRLSFSLLGFGALSLLFIQITD
jgi:hypothetical protein